MASPRDIERIKKFSDWLKQEALDHGFKSQRQFSLASKVSSATISRIYNYLQLPDDETIKKIATALEKPVKEVLLMAGYPVESGGSEKTKQQKKPKDLLRLLEQEEYTLNGELASPEDKERIKRIVEAMYWDAKEKNKRK